VFYETVNFFTSELSARYLDITRDRLYTYRTTEEARRSVQTVIYEVVTKTAAALAPIFSFTTEDVWQHLWREVFAPLGQPFGENDLAIPGSVHWCEFPSADPAWPLSEEERAKFEKLFALKDLVNVALEGWRRQLQAQNAPKGSGNSMAAQVLLYAAPGSPEDHLLSGNLVDLEEFFIVSRVQQTAPSGEDSEWVRDERSSFAVKIVAATGEKCPRCWRYTGDVKERPGLVPSATDFPKAAAEGPVSFALCDRCADELA
jgi:isoleucyl-tRNA synthetase